MIVVVHVTPETSLCARQLRRMTKQFLAQAETWFGCTAVSKSDPIISRMKDRFEPPLASKTTWEKAILVLNGENTNIESLVEEMSVFSFFFRQRSFSISLGLR